MGDEWVMLEDFGVELTVNLSRPSKHLIARKRHHWGPGVGGLAKDHLYFGWAALCSELLPGYEDGPKEWF